MADGAVLLLHGLGRSASDWAHVRAGLERYGAVQAPDLPRGAVEDVLAIGAALPPSSIVVGHSLSGVVALRLAARAGSAVDALVLTDSFFPPALNGRTRAAALTDYGRHRLAIGRELAARGARPRPRRDTWRGMRSLARLGLRPDAFHALAAAVRAPVLVLHGTHDHHVPLDFAAAAASRHASWTLHTLDGGHDLHVEHPREWMAAVSAWLG